MRVLRTEDLLRDSIEYRTGHSDETLASRAGEVFAFVFRRDVALNEDILSVSQDSRGASPAIAQVAFDDFLDDHGWFLLFSLTQNPGSVSEATREGSVFDQSGCRKYLNWRERRAYRRVIGKEADLRRRAFMLTIFFTGCRISEALNLLAGRVDAAAGTLTFETLKRRKSGCFRAVPIPPVLAKALHHLVSGKSPECRVWNYSRSTAYRMTKAKMKDAKISGAMAMPKGLRHGLAVACLTVKIPLPTIQKWLGHARLDTTAIYLDVLGEEERALAKRLW